MEQQFAGWRKKFFVIWTGPGHYRPRPALLYKWQSYGYITGKEDKVSGPFFPLQRWPGSCPRPYWGMFIGVLIDQHDRKKINDLLGSGDVLSLWWQLAVSRYLGDIPIWLSFYCIIHPKHWQCVLRPVLQGYYAVHLTKGPADKICRLFKSFESASMIASPAIAAVLYCMFPLKAIPDAGYVGERFLQWVPWRQWIYREFSGKIREKRIFWLEVKEGITLCAGVLRNAGAAGNWRIICSHIFSP